MYRADFWRSMPGKWGLLGRRMVLSLLGLFTLLPQTFAQDFYLVDTIDYTALFDYIDIQRRIINLQTCGLSQTADSPVVGYPGALIDIACTGTAPPYLTLTRGDYDEGVDSIVNYTTEAALRSPFRGGVSITLNRLPIGIATDYALRTVVVGDEAAIVDFPGDSLILLGNLGEYAAAGQMTFRQGSFYYPGVNNELVQFKVDANRQIYTRSVGSLPDTLQYGGLFTVPMGCDSSRTYLVHRDPLRGSTVFELKFPTLELVEVCALPYKAISAAFDRENIHYCDTVVVDLAPAEATRFSRVDTICGRAVPLHFDSLLISPQHEFDSIVVSLQNPLDGAAEQLTYGTLPAGVLLRQSDSRTITLRSSGFTELAAFYAALRTLGYRNEAPEPTLGRREIRIRAYHPYLGWNEASLYLELSEVVRQLGHTLAQPDCHGEPGGSIELELGSYTGSEPVTWSDGVTGLQRTSLVAGTYSYEWYDAYGCAFRDTLLVTEPDSLRLELLGIINPNCGEVDTLRVQVSGGTGGYRYQWSDGSSGTQLAGLLPGEYTLTLTDANACEVQAGYTQAWPDTAAVGRLTETACIGDTLYYAQAEIVGDTSFVVYRENELGCDSVTLLQYTFLSGVSVRQDYALCAGETININGQVVGQDSSWQLRYTAANGCDSVVDYRVRIAEDIQVYYQIIPPACGSDVGQLIIDRLSGGQGPYTLLELAQDIPPSGLSLSLSAGDYRYRVLDADGCSGVLNFTIPVSLPPTASLSQDSRIKLGESITLEAEPAFAVANVQWRPATGLSCDTCLRTRATPSQTTRYRVVLTDELGCSWQGETTVFVEEQGVYVPSAFSPNADGSNDLLTVYPSSSVQAVQRFEVYDRWGNTVYASEGQEISWDGYGQGQPLPAGVYVYWLEWTDVRGRRQTSSGEIHLLR